MTGRTAMPTVLVVGATSGIGRAAARGSRGRGAAWSSSRSPETLELARQECAARGAEAVLVVPTDVGDRRRWRRCSRGGGAGSGASTAWCTPRPCWPTGGSRTSRPGLRPGVRTNLPGAANVARGAWTLRGAGGRDARLVGSVLAKIATPYMARTSRGSGGCTAWSGSSRSRPGTGPGSHVSLVSPGGVNTPIYDLAGTYTGRPGTPPPPVIAPERAAAKVVAALDRPKRDLAAGPANWVMVAGFRMLPAVYDALVGPMMRALVRVPRRRREPGERPGARAVLGSGPRPLASRLGLNDRSRRRPSERQEPEPRAERSAVELQRQHRGGQAAGRRRPARRRAPAGRAPRGTRGRGWRRARRPRSP